MERIEREFDSLQVTSVSEEDARYSEFQNTQTQIPKINIRIPLHYQPHGLEEDSEGN